MIELFKFIPLHKGNPFTEAQANIYGARYVPTEVVVEDPQHVVPWVARVYSVDRWVYDGRLLDNYTLAALPDFRGTAHYDQVMLVEVWMNCGEDGHTEYKLCGHRFVPQSRLSQETSDKRFHTSYSCRLPICMTMPDGEWGYEAQYKLALERPLDKTPSLC